MIDQKTFQRHPMYSKWSLDMRKELLDTLKGVEKLNVTNKQDWLRFREQIQTQTYFCLTNSINNPHFIAVWEHKGNALALLYEQVDWLLRRHSPPFNMSEVYREKYEQALDWLAQRAEHIPPLLRVEINMEQDQQLIKRDCDHLAKQILKKRSEWIHKMSMVEQLRKDHKKEIFETDDIEMIDNASQRFMDQIKQYDKLWITF